MKARIVLTAFLCTLAGYAGAETAGEKLFNHKCAMCHVVRGRGGQIGPELTSVAGRLSEAQLRAKIAFPKRSNPSSIMPSFQTLPAADMNALISYLKTLR